MDIVFVNIGTSSRVGVQVEGSGTGQVQRFLAATAYETTHINHIAWLMRLGESRILWCKTCVPSEAAVPAVHYI